MRQPVIDHAIERRSAEGFTFPLGVYPGEQLSPRAGYVLEFEPADGGEEGGAAGDWEEWPDRFMFDVAISASRLPALVRLIIGMLPGRLYPILDVLGIDAYREIDPYIAYEPVGIERFHDAMRSLGEWLLEDGLVGFGAISVDPFFYFFVDEHKILTIRTSLDRKDTMAKLLAAFDLEEVDEIRGADAAEHEHRGVLALETDTDAPNANRLIEHLKDAWLLQLNVDAVNNVDDEGKELGVTAWRCLVRTRQVADAPPRYGEVWLTAENLDVAEQLCFAAVSGAASQTGEDATDWHEVNPVFCDRVTPESFARQVGVPAHEVPGESRVIAWHWLNGLQSTRSDAERTPQPGGQNDSQPDSQPDSHSDKQTGPDPSTADPHTTDEDTPGT